MTKLPQNPNDSNPKASNNFEGAVGSPGVVFDARLSSSCGDLL